MAEQTEQEREGWVQRRTREFTSPGTLMKNGARVIAYRPGRREDEGIVLASLGREDQDDPIHALYATWRMNPVTGHTWSGEYLLTFEGALRSFAARTGLVIEALGGRGLSMSIPGRCECGKPIGHR